MIIGPDPITKILLIEFTFGIVLNIDYEYKKRCYFKKSNTFKMIVIQHYFL